MDFDLICELYTLNIHIYMILSAHKKKKKSSSKGSMMNHFDVVHFFTTGAEVKGLRSVLCQSGVWEGHVRWEEERPGCGRFLAALSGLSVQPEAGSLDPARYGVSRYPFK